MNKISIVFSIFFFLATLSFAQEASMSNEAAKLYNAGYSAYKSGDYSGAVNKFKSGLDIEKHYKLYFYIGQSFRKQNKYDEAIQNYNLALTAKADYYQAHFYMASCLFSQKKYDDAKAAFEKTKTLTKNKKVIRSCDKNISKCKSKVLYPILVEAKKQKDAKNYNASIKNYNKYLEGTKSEIAYVGLAEIYVETGKYEDALQAADAAINSRERRSKVPKGAAYFFKALAFKGLQETAKAREYFNKAVKDKVYKDRCNYELKYLK